MATTGAPFSSYLLIMWLGLTVLMQVLQVGLTVT